MNGYAFTVVRMKEKGGEDGQRGFSYIREPMNKDKKSLLYFCGPKLFVVVNYTKM